MHAGWKRWWTTELKRVRWIAIAALGFLGVTAFIGAVPMILHPSGEPWQMPQSLLQPSPFHSYLIPGIILLMANGVMSLFALYAAARLWPGYGRWVAFQGCILAGWIAVEVGMLRMAIWPHYFYGAISLVLIAAGLALRRNEHAT
jgi:hypothetical protein